MGYRIEYDRESGKYEVTKGHPYRFAWISAIGFGVFLMLAAHFWPREAEALRSAIIPGEDSVTIQAFRNLTDDLRSGARMGEAVESFCRFVIYGE